MQYHFKEIEAKWQKYWFDNQLFKASENQQLPKYYVLDMFPYPSGAGLHVGHPLGYIASDIYARYKRHMGFNVLHPMGYDSFGLPAEQYAIQTGQHPAITTKQNIAKYREQLDKIGFSFDWSKEVQTSSPEYYRWTQWIFIQLFNSWYNLSTNKTESIDSLITSFEQNGNQQVLAVSSFEKIFTASQWQEYNEKEKADVLMNYRIAYLGDAYVNWCEALGTVLANDEVKDGLSERGGHPVERKLMRQWSMRISAYAERLLQDLYQLDWTDALKDSQKNWIGKSVGCSLKFQIENSKEFIEVFTTRADTIFGVSFLTLAPEHELVAKITTNKYKTEVESYVQFAKNRSERERMADVKKITGQFTGAYVIHPFSNNKIPIWIGDYVLATYGTGAVMAVPAHDTRDYAFAKHFNLPILQVIEGGDISTEAYDAKSGKLINSDFLNDLDVKEAMLKAIANIEQKKIGIKQTNYKLRDAIFGRQRYWGEPIPIYYKNGIAHTIPLNDLPLVLPNVDAYLPTAQGEPPLARASNWTYKPKNDDKAYPLETTTMPGWAGSSWYFLRYMDANNNNEFVSKSNLNYWKNVDLYIGGAEHATGHLLYVRFWTKALFDLGFLPMNEPANKLINQGMIQGRSSFVYRINGTNQFVTASLKNNYQTTALHADVNFVKNDVLDIQAFKNWRSEYGQATFILEENGTYICGHEVEKMSKSKYNVVTPDLMIDQYGADTLRLYEMFLGPLELAKPWNTNGIEGVHRFLKKVMRCIANENGNLIVENIEPTSQELKALHKCIKRVNEDIQRFSFNTSVSTFMICINELQEIKCKSKAIYETFLKLLSPYAPHIAEELWYFLGNKKTIAFEPFPQHNEDFLVENSFAYPVSINGKMRFNQEYSLAMDVKTIEEQVLLLEETQKHIAGKTVKKVIIVHGKIINLVVA